MLGFHVKEDRPGLALSLCATFPNPAGELLDICWMDLEEPTPESLPASSFDLRPSPLAAGSLCQTLWLHLRHKRSCGMLPCAKNR
jgi:hypothetical protein